MTSPTVRSRAGVAGTTVTTLHGRQDLPDLWPLYFGFRDMPLVSISNAQRKPVVLLKIGSTKAGARMAASHTGHLTGSDEIVDGLFRQYNVIRVRDLDELLETSALLAKLPAGTGPNVAATITPQHLHINRNAMLVGGIRPHAYCLPVAKREKHRLALRKAATSGSPKFFLGTDSAPHARHLKETACGCAGIFNAPFALESYLAVFEEERALSRFEGFASLHGPAFYGLPVNSGTVTLERADTAVPAGFVACGEPDEPYPRFEGLGQLPLQGPVVHPDARRVVDGDGVAVGDVVGADDHQVHAAGAG